MNLKEIMKCENIIIVNDIMVHFDNNMMVTLQEWNVILRKYKILKLKSIIHKS